MFNIFENPWSLLIAAIVVLLGLWILRSVSPEKVRWWLWLAPVLIAGAAFEVDFFIETDREKIGNVIYALTKAVEEEKCEALASLIADNYNDSYHKTKKQLMAHCKVRLASPLVERAIPRVVSNDQTSSVATVIFTVRVLFDKDSDVSQLYKQDIFFKVQAGLEKQPDNRWLVNTIEIIEIDRLPAKWQTITQG